MDLDSPWDDAADPNTTSNTEWTKISSEFTNAGYREGITAGKESSVQEGFDDGFESVGAPIGRELGILRGISSGIVSYLSTSRGLSEQDVQLVEAREIASQLSKIRFSDIAPKDLEAEQHALEHMGDDEDGVDEDEEMAEKRKMEGLEDMLARIGTANDDQMTQRPTLDDVKRLKERLQALVVALGLPEILWS